MEADDSFLDPLSIRDWEINFNPVGKTDGVVAFAYRQSKTGYLYWDKVSYHDLPKVLAEKISAYVADVQLSKG
jgi:hypothetical protein